MATLLGTLNSIREQTITKHYDAAIAELNEKIEAEPLKTVFHIKAGCVSREITDEIARRFNNGGLLTTACRTGLLSTYNYLTVEVSLPEHLVPLVKEEKREESTVESKDSTTQVTEADVIPAAKETEGTNAL